MKYHKKIINLKYKFKFYRINKFIIFEKNY